MLKKIDVSIIMGSDSDWPYTKPAVEKLEVFGLKYEVRVISAHRTPTQLVEYVNSLKERGVQTVICAAGWAAALPGCVAAQTHLPVIGIPIPNSPLNGIDAILATLQMPAGVPVATMSLGKAGAANAAIFCARIVALSCPEMREKVAQFHRDMEAKVLVRDKALQDKLERGEA
jgi:phosphoribosylaminoimidazole carboxylase PurE protein